jgi:hypothetical protein
MPRHKEQGRALQWLLPEDDADVEFGLAICDSYPKP